MQRPIRLLRLDAIRITRGMFRIKVLWERIRLHWCLLMLQGNLLCRQNILLIFNFDVLNDWPFEQMRSVQNSPLILLVDRNIGCHNLFVWITLSYLVKLFSSLSVYQTVQVYFVFLSTVFKISFLIWLCFCFFHFIILIHFLSVFFVLFGDLLPYWLILYFRCVSFIFILIFFNSDLVFLAFLWNLSVHTSFIGTFA